MNILGMIWKKVKVEENYVERDYKTIGGMWTVDIWQKKNVVCQLMDEGYTQSIILLDDDDITIAKVYLFCSGLIEYTIGNETMFEEAYKELDN